MKRMHLVAVALTIALGEAAFFAASARSAAASDARSSALQPLTTRGTVAIALKFPAGNAVSVAGSFTIVSDGVDEEIVNVAAGATSLTAHPPVGTHVLRLTQYDRADARGTIIALGTTRPVTVPAGGQVGVSLVLGAVVGRADLSLAYGNTTFGSPAAIALRVVSRDPDGSYITIGSPYAYPLILTSSDPVTGKLSSTQLSAVPEPGQPVYLTYTGAPAARITISASSVGLTAETPAVLVPLAAPPPGEQLIATGGADLNTAFGLTRDFQLLATFGALPQPFRSPYNLTSYGAVTVDASSRLAYVADFQHPPGARFDVFGLRGAYAAVDAFAAHGLPLGIALDALGRKLYATDAASTDVSIVSTAPGHALIGVIHTGIHGSNLAVDPNARRLYVSGAAFIDCGGPATGLRVFSTVPPYAQLGALTRASYGPIAIDSAARKLYVVESTSAGRNLLDVYDTAALALLARVPVGGLPCSLALDVQGRRAYVGSFGAIYAYGLDNGLQFVSALPNVGGTSLAVAPYNP